MVGIWKIITCEIMNSDPQRKTTVRSKTTQATRLPQTEALITATPAPAPKSEVRKPKAYPTHQEIAKRAHELYLARGSAHGRDREDWIQAERELLAASNRFN
jgi:Protein of unknown function (DUF2934)